MYGGKDFLKRQYPSVASDGIIASPSLRGTQLFLAAHGYLDISANKLCNSSLELELWDKIKPLREVVATNNLQSKVQMKNTMNEIPTAH